MMQQEIKISDKTKERKKRTCMDVMKEIVNKIKEEYPAISEAHATRLALLLTKAEQKGELDSIN